MMQWLMLCAYCLPKGLKGSHGICPRCYERIMGEAYRFKNVAGALAALLPEEKDDTTNLAT